MNKVRSAAGRETNIILERLFSEAISSIVLCESLKRADPKSHDRMSGHLQAAKRELFRLIRKERRTTFSKVVQRLRLDPEGPLRIGVVEKYGQRYEGEVKIERRTREINRSRI